MYDHLTYACGIFIHMDVGGKMMLLLCIIGSILLGFLLFASFGNFGVIIMGGILLGCMFRGLYLLSRIHTHLFQDVPKKDKVKEAYRRYLEEGK